jgi:hypothetical protein
MFSYKSFISHNNFCRQYCWNRVLVVANINCNGTAVAGVNVTGAAIRLIVPVASKERVPVASQYGAVFAITVREGFITIAV